MLLARPSPLTAWNPDGATAVFQPTCNRTGSYIHTSSWAGYWQTRLIHRCGAGGFGRRESTVKRAGDPILNLRRDLSRIVGAAHVLDPGQLDPYTHDATIQRGLRAVPDAVVRPADAQELTRVLAWCYEHELPIVARGGGSGLAGGALATEGGVICSTERLTGVLECEPQLWRISVQAGLSTANVQRLARENGLLFAPDPGAGEQSQIGGNVATNAAGPHAFKYGPTGAWVSGLQVALAPGELVNIGGHCRKDVGG